MFVISLFFIYYGKHMHLSVVIPAYNEEERISKTLESINEYLSRQNFAYEIIVVNNNSQDKTAALVKEYEKRIHHIRLLDEPKPGKGYAVTKGILESQGKYRLFTDADNSTTIDHIEKMMPYFDKGYDVVIGSLAVKGARIMQGGGEPWWRVLMGKAGNKFIQIFAVWGINDTQRGFKIFTEQAVKDIFPRLTIFGWGFDVEVLALAKRFKYKIKEVPVTWNNDPNSKVNFWSYPQVLGQTLKVFWNLHTGKYS
ncbi:MAG TPA: dolichyl-phosphate beta-glucosyltransferase [Candidatus Paceibacterota bacterium]|nr:dolichyl-phosphate beta-glucosyltransferase [Candidatus Paceibacterota bacterium]